MIVWSGLLFSRMQGEQLLGQPDLVGIDREKAGRRYQVAGLKRTGEWPYFFCVGSQVDNGTMNAGS
jgi:hypothetical protein